MLDIDTQQSMPPAPLVPYETDEERKQRMIRAAGGMTGMPAAPLTQPPAQPRSATPATAMPPTPTAPPVGSSPASVTPFSPKERELVVGATSPPNPPAPKPPSAAPAAPEIPNAAPGMPPAGIMVAPSAPAKPAMPAAPVVNVPGYEQGGPRNPQGAGPELHGWKKVLDIIGSMFPIGRAVETAIPGSPQNFDYKRAVAGAREQQEQGITKGRQEIESAASQAQFNTPEKRRAYMEQNPDLFKDVSDFEKNDFVLAGKFPQKEPAADTTGKTPEETTIHDLMTGENGQPRINPETGKPYSYLEAFGAVKEKAQGAKPDKIVNAKEDLQRQIAAADAKGDKATVKTLQARLKAIDPEGQQRMQITVQGQQAVGERAEKAATRTEIREHDKAYVQPAEAVEKSYQMMDSAYKEYLAAKAQGKQLPTGAQSMLALSTHLTTTFGNVKGARITKDMIEHHLGARSISDSALVAFQRLTNGDVLSPDQWEAFHNLIGESRKLSWQAAEKQAKRKGIPVDFLPDDLEGGTASKLAWNPKTGKYE